MWAAPSGSPTRTPTGGPSSSRMHSISPSATRSSSHPSCVMPSTATRRSGVYQLESAGMRRYVQDLQPTDISDLCALVALYRPGPMQQIPRFIDGKHGRIKITYPHPDLANVLDETHGVIVYQDQVLFIL